MTMKAFAASIATLLLLTAALLPIQARAEDDDTDILSEARILHDPAIPAVGNTDGDITIVEYFDYQCPYCRKISPELARVVRHDGHVRLVFKDWPIFGGVSIYAARLTLAARYQDKFAEAHEALISLNEKLSEAKVDAVLTSAGIDLARAKADLEAKRADIDAVLRTGHRPRLPRHARLHHRPLPRARRPQRPGPQAGDCGCACRGKQMITAVEQQCGTSVPAGFDRV